MSQRNVELVRRAFGVVTMPGDPDAMIVASHPDFEMHLRFKATDLRDLGDRVLVLGTSEVAAA